MYTPNFRIRHALHRINPILLQYGCTSLEIASRIHSYCSWIASVSFIAVISMMFVVVCKMATQSFTGLVSIAKVHVLYEEITAQWWLSWWLERRNEAGRYVGSPKTAKNRYLRYVGAPNKNMIIEHRDPTYPWWNHAKFRA